jgi:AcrR family transcriptional regulator
LWVATVEEHRQAVREATMEATARLALDHGIAALTMSQVAEEAGIGRATLYKYFPDVESILVAWHERHVEHHLDHLAAVAAATEPEDRVAAVLTAYALIRHEHHGGELGALLHRGEHVARAEQRLRDFLRDLLAAGAGAGDVRGDVPPRELAGYCLHALAAAPQLRTKAAVRRLVAVTLAGLAP